MKHLNYFLLAVMAVLCNSCTTPVQVKPWNPLRLLPWVSGSTTDTLNQAPPDYGWMWQMLAIAVVAFAIASSWIAKRVTKGSLILLGSGLFVSWWGASLSTIQDTMRWTIPTIVVAFLVWGFIDLGFRIYGRYFKGKRRA